MLIKKLACWLAGLVLLVNAHAVEIVNLDQGFTQPPPSVRLWVFWFWINGNISKEGITANLQALQHAGVGGVIWMEVSVTQMA